MHQRLLGLFRTIMIKRKKKICRGRGKYSELGCGQERFIFSHGLCQQCIPKVPLKRTPLKKTAIKQSYKPTVQDGAILSQKKAFEKAYEHYKGRCYINDVPIQKFDLRHWNCMHVLPKKNYQFFKYYWRNIVIGLKVHHDLYDQGTWDRVMKERILTKLDPLSGWQMLYKLRLELIEEYMEWVKNNPGRYRV